MITTEITDSLILDERELLLSRVERSAADETNDTRRSIMNSQKLAEAESILVRSHKELHDDIQIYRFEDDEQVKLLEVSGDFPASGVFPTYFGESMDVPAPSGVILMAPVEFKRIMAGEDELPDGWDKAHMHQVWPTV